MLNSNTLQKTKIYNTFLMTINKYSQTCIKRSPLRQIKSGLLRQVTS